MYIETFKMGIKDIDKNLNILNRAILEMLENAAVYHADSVNRGPMVTFSEHFAWVLSDWQIKVIDRPKYGEELSVKTWRRDSKPFHTYREYEVCDSKGNTKIVATSKWVIFNFDTQKLMPITAELDKWNLHNEEESCLFENRKITKIEIPENFENFVEYTVMRKDIDLNGHAHNLTYLDFACEALPEEVYQNKVFDNIKINYKKEIKLHDTIICKYAKVGEKYIVVIENKNTKVKHAVIELY